jgi:hypothetical protein
MVEAGLCRNRINKDITRIKRVFKWGAIKKHVSLAVWQSLNTVEGLRAGRSQAKEGDWSRRWRALRGQSHVEGLGPHLRTGGPRSGSRRRVNMEAACRRGR